MSTGTGWAADELPRLLKSLGIDETTLSRTQPVLQRDMIRVCAACRQKARCNADLDAGTLAQHYEEYCPNAPAIEELGQVGDGHGRGYYCHNSLAVTPQRKVIGLVHQQLHTRRHAPKGKQGRPRG